MGKSKKLKQKRNSVLLLVTFFFLGNIGHASSLAVSPSRLQITQQNTSLLIYNPSLEQQQITITISNQTLLAISAVKRMQENGSWLLLSPNQKENKKKKEPATSAVNQKRGIIQENLLLEPLAAAVIWVSRKNDAPGNGEINIETNELQYSVPVTIEEYKKNNEILTKNDGKKRMITLLGTILVIIGSMGIAIVFFFFKQKPETLIMIPKNLRRFKEQKSHVAEEKNTEYEQSSDETFLVKNGDVKL
ncbi:MAG: hypothetical protein QW594_02425 [Candidatus Woesearchaeota archaeon]